MTNSVPGLSLQTSYEVQKGDTLTKIVKENGGDISSFEAIKENTNGEMTDVNLILEGQTLFFGTDIIESQIKDYLSNETNSALLNELGIKAEDIDLNELASALTESYADAGELQKGIEELFTEISSAAYNAQDVYDSENGDNKELDDERAYVSQLGTSFSLENLEQAKKADEPDETAQNPEETKPESTTEKTKAENTSEESKSKNTVEEPKTESPKSKFGENATQIHQDYEADRANNEAKKEAIQEKTENLKQEALTRQQQALEEINKLDSDTLGGAIKETVGDIGNYLLASADAKIKSDLDTISDIFTEAQDFFYDTTSHIEEGLAVAGDIAGDVVAGISGVAEGVADTVGDIAKDAADAVGGFFKGIGDTVGGWFSAGVDKRHQD